MALIDVEPGHGWDQFCTPFDYQDEEGRLPDNMNWCDINWVYYKPPIHGMAMRLAEGFCDNILVNGFAENYSPIDGSPQNDPAYSWSASIYILLTRYIHKCRETK